jgi:hypothetical protein
MLEKDPAIGFKETTNVLRQSVDGLVDNQLVSVAPPSRGALRDKHRNSRKHEQKACPNLRFSEEPRVYLQCLYLALAVRSVLRFRPKL